MSIETETGTEAGPASGTEAVSAALPNLIEDVDTIDDLRRLHLRRGPRSHNGLAGLPAEALL